MGGPEALFNRGGGDNRYLYVKTQWKVYILVDNIINGVPPRQVVQIQTAGSVI